MRPPVLASGALVVVVLTGVASTKIPRVPAKLAWNCGEAQLSDDAVNVPAGVVNVSGGTVMPPSFPETDNSVSP